MNQLRVDDISRALLFLPEEVLALCHSEGRNLVIAGGFLRAVVQTEMINDIDIFGCSKEILEKSFEALKLELGSKGVKVKTITTNNSYTIKQVGGHTVQFVHRWIYDSPEAHIQSFDYTISKAALWYDKESGEWKSVVDERFYEDCEKHKLVFTSPVREEEPAGSLLRAFKFTKLGYEINAESLAGVITKVVEGSNQGTEDLGLNLKERVSLRIHRVGGGRS